MFFIMAHQLDSDAELATLKRSEVVCSLIQRTFAHAFSHLCRLEGRTIQQYGKVIGIPYIHKFFYHDMGIIEGNTPVEDYTTRILHKLLKTCCGLKPPRDKMWESLKEEEEVTLEFLITFCWSEHESLLQAKEMTDNERMHHMERVLEALVLIIDKVEEIKDVDLSAFKSELTKRIGEKLDMYNDSPVSHHMYHILSQHSVHKMFVIVYQELNILQGMRLSTFLISRRMNLVSHTAYSNESKFLEQDPPPQNMSISILFKVLKRVCFGFSPYERRKQTSVLESTLNTLMTEYNTHPANEDEYLRKSYNIYTLLKKALIEVHKQKEGKSIQKIIQNLPSEPYVVESFRRPFELPTCSVQPVSVAPAPESHTSREASAVSTDCPAYSPHAMSQAMAVASHADSSSAVITQEMLNVAVLFSVMCPEGLAVQTLALVFKALQGNVSVLSGRFLRNFTRDEKQSLQSLDLTNVDDLANKDITFLCKLIRSGCPSLSSNDDDWTIPGYTLEYYITFIRKERNKLSHEVKTIETDLLGRTLDSIAVYLDTILELTELKVERSEVDIKNQLENQRKKVRSYVNELKKSVPSISYYTAVEKMTEDLTRKIVRGARKELQEKYLWRENLDCLSPLRDVDDTQHLTTKNVYVDRRLEDTDGASYRMKDILFPQSNVFASSRVIVIHGRTGEGKTSLSKYAYHLWSENLAEAAQNGVDLLIYIPCRFVTTRSISAYLKSRLPETLRNIHTDDVVPLMQEPGVVFVIDGYDEAGGEVEGLVDDIMTLLPASRVIITAKTQWASKIIQRVKSVTSCYKVLSLMEVTDNELQEFISKVFAALGKDTQSCDRFLAYLTEVKEDIDSLIYCPLTICLLSLLWIKKPELARKIKTSAQLYHKLIDLILERVSEKLSKDKFFFYKWMTTLGQIAWKYIKNNQHQLNNQDLNTLKERALDLTLSLDDNNYILSSLLQCDKAQDRLDGEADLWSFMRNNQREFFAAVYLVHSLRKEESSLRKILELDGEQDEQYQKRLQKLEPVIEFVYGLLDKDGELTETRLTEIMEIMSVKEPWAFVAVARIFKPMLQKPGMKHAVKTLFTNQEMSTFDKCDPQSVLWVLKHTSLTVCNPVTLINTQNDLPHVKPLLEFLRSKSYSVNVKVDVNKASSVYDLANFTGDMRSEDVITTFAPWKPLCIAKLVQDWPWSDPLRLSLHPDVFHLLWWELLINLLSLHVRVTKIIYGSGFGELIEEGAKWLCAETATDLSLAPTELLIHCVSESE